MLKIISLDVNLNMQWQKEEVKLNFLCLIQKRWEEIMFSLFVYIDALLVYIYIYIYIYIYMNLLISGIHN